MALVLSKIDICNQALSYLGALKLEETDLTLPDLQTDEGLAAQVCNLFYDVSLYALIEDFGWNESAAKLQYTPAFQEYITKFSTDKIDITGITQANPTVVTAVSHGLSNKTHVNIEDVGGMTDISGIYYIDNVTANTFELTGVNSTNYDAYTSGGTVVRIQPFEKNFDGFTYVLPDDLILPLRLESGYEYRIFRDELVTIDSDAILYYARLIEDSESNLDLSSFNASFLEAFKIKLASNIAPRAKGFAKANQAKEVMFQEYNIALDAAKLKLNRNVKFNMRYTGKYNSANRGGYGNKLYPNFFNPRYY